MDTANQNSQNASPPFDTQLISQNCKPYCCVRATSTSFAAFVYCLVDSPRHTLTVASRTCKESASDCVNTITGSRPSCRHERATRRAISPRLATNTRFLGPKYASSFRVAKLTFASHFGSSSGLLSTGSLALAQSRAGKSGT